MIHCNPYPCLLVGNYSRTVGCQLSRFVQKNVWGLWLQKQFDSFAVFLISLWDVNLKNEGKCFSCLTCFCSNLHLWSGPQQYHRECRFWVIFFCRIMEGSKITFPATTTAEVIVFLHTQLRVWTSDENQTDCYRQWSMFLFCIKINFVPFRGKTYEWSRTKSRHSWSTTSLQ